MIETLAVSGYRSLRDIVVPMGPLTVITGPNGSGKSNLYRALRLLADCARGTVVPAIAAEGGLDSAFWAGRPGRSAREPKRLRLGYGTSELSYAISLGLAPPSRTAFALDPLIKSEAIWAGPLHRPAAQLVRRLGPTVSIRDDRSWREMGGSLPDYSSMFDSLGDPAEAPEVFAVRESIRSWVFYDHFRTDRTADVRQPQLGTRTPRLHPDGRDLAAAVQTIREIGDGDALGAAVVDAFPGAAIGVRVQDDGRFALLLEQPGLMRPLTAAELSDGTLRYLCWAAALLTPRPPALMVLNEPETSLHPRLLAPLARLIVGAAATTQVWVVSHSLELVSALAEAQQCLRIDLQRDSGATVVVGAGLLDSPPWRWPE